MTSRTTVHQLKITLRGTKPSVWRRVLIASDSTLADLHDVIQAAFGWFGYHLHEFEIDGVRYGVPDEEEDWGEPPADERSGRLDQLTREGARITYTYDFGDDWIHTVEVEKVLPAERGVNYPACIGGRRACPPEDCGGAWGYANFLAAIADPAHEDHAGKIEWVGGGFDPEAFDPTEFEQRLKDGPVFDD